MVTSLDNVIKSVSDSNHLHTAVQQTHEIRTVVHKGNFTNLV